MSIDDRDISQYTFPEFYRAMVEREHLQVSRDEARWSERYSEPDRTVDVVLNFGCNVRQTPHLMREAVAVLETLGVDFAAVAGQQYCCGKPYFGDGFDDVGMKVLGTTIDRMRSFKPRRAIQWCSACEMTFHDVATPQLGIEFQSHGLAAFLIERLDELGDRVPWRKDVAVTGVVHGHLGEHVVRDGHLPLALQLLSRVPGVRVVGRADIDALEICDNHGVAIASIGSEEYRRAQEAIENGVHSAGADTLVTLYHACTRELGKFASERLAIRHYISIVAEALGVAKPDRFSEYWRLADADAVMERSRPNWSSWGIREEDARRLAHKHFIPSYVGVPSCPCNGNCTQTGAEFLGVNQVVRARS